MERQTVPAYYQWTEQRGGEPDTPRSTAEERFSRESDWRSSLEHRFRRIIQSRLGEHNVLPERVRQVHSETLGHVKFPTEQYAGENDPGILEAWLLAHTRWLQIRQAVGQEAEPVRKLALPLGLSGKALVYFNEEIDDVDLQVNWTYEKAVVAIMYRFITMRALSRAIGQFETVKYKADEGILIFYSTLKRLNRQMSHDPGQRMMNIRLMRAIPTHIRSMISPQVYPGDPDTDTLVAEIERVEAVAAEMAEMAEASRASERWL